MDATATVLDPLGLDDEDVETIPAGGATGTRTIRRSLFENRVNWGSAAESGIQGPSMDAGTDALQSPPGPVTLAHTFTIMRDCDLVAVRIYKHPDLTGTIDIALWDSAGTELATESVAWIADFGGRVEVELGPVALTADSEYTLGYLSPGDDYVYSPFVWNAQATIVYPFHLQVMTEVAGVRSNGSGKKSGATITWPTTVSADRSPANYYIDPIVEWEDDLPGYTGGTDYYEQFVNGQSGFAFPVGVFFADPEFLEGYAALGVNTLMAGSVTDPYIDAVKASGMEWYPTLHGGDMTAPVVVQEDTALGALVRGYVITDEPDLNSPYNDPATLLEWRNSCRALDSTRPCTLNLGKHPVVNQGFAPLPVGAGIEAWNESWREFAALADILSCDQYSISATDSFNPDLTAASPNRYGIWAYPPQVKRMAELNDGRTPVWGVVESTSAIPDSPTPDEVARATWALLIAGARGIVFFDHRFADADVTQDFAAMLNDPAMSAAITVLATQLQVLGPALHAAEAGLVTEVSSSGVMDAAQGGYADGALVPVHYATRSVGSDHYIFAQAIREGSTTATFTVPTLADETLTVIGESRTVAVDGLGEFNDFFAADYEYHLYTTTAEPEGTLPVNTVAPAITADPTPQAGETIVSSTGTWAGVPSFGYAFQWQRDGVDITGGTSASYTLVSADIAHVIRCKVTATNSSGSDFEYSDTITPDPPPEGEALDLPMVDWEGGPDYWSGFAKATAAGWTDPDFFPIAVFLGKPDSGHPADLAAIGINTYMAAEGESPGLDLTEIAAAGIFVMAHPDNPYEHDLDSPGDPQVTEDGWDFSELGAHASVVSWFMHDEPDQGYGGWPGDGHTNDNPDGYLDAVQGVKSIVTGYADGRFHWMNFGNGVLNTFWSDTLPEMLDEVHGLSVDKYPYTSPGVRFEYGRSEDWQAACGSSVEGIASALSQTSAAYGWMARQMRETFGTTDKPVWAFVETKMPKLNESGSTIITHAQMEGAVFSWLANEARGIAYFQHNGDSNFPAIDPNTGTTPTEETYSLVDGPATYANAVSAINAKVMALAPVLNTQSFEWNFGPSRVDTMLKAPDDGFAYIFASIGPGGTTGSKTFTLPAGVTGTTVTVLNESRTVSVSSGQFTDTFAHEYSHHVYKVAI